MVDRGRASVWMCKDFEREGHHVAAGCGFIGLYKPEMDPPPSGPRRICPGCHKAITYKPMGDIALIDMEPS